MNLTLSCPSKTFLFGEYAVLLGAPAVLINTVPRFQLKITKGSGRSVGFSLESPAGRWFELRRPLLETFDIEFVDPHSGGGGFGASGAQFLLLHAFTTLTQWDFDQEKIKSAEYRHSVWNDYQVLTQSQGSGADIRAQHLGTVSFLVDQDPEKDFRQDWPYADMDFALFRTRSKIQTHVHLRDLDRRELSSLVPLARHLFERFQQVSADDFLVDLKVFKNKLTELNLQVSSDLQRQLEREDWCLLAKGCGALGADTVMVFFAPIRKKEALESLRKKGFDRILTNSDLSPGLTL